MTNHIGSNKKVVVTAVLLVLGLALFAGCTAIKGETMGEYIDASTITTEANAIVVQDSDAKYFKIDVSTTQGNVVLQGFVNSKNTEDRIIAKIKALRGVKSVKSLLNIERKQ